MRLLSRTPVRLAVVALAQLLLVGVAVAPRLSAWATGEEYLLEVTGYDPHDPFRGAYASLAYPGLPSGRRVPDGAAYLPLVRDGEVWVADRVLTERPAEGPYLACEGDGWGLDCGIGSWFAHDEEALAVEDALRSGSGMAVVRVDSRGHAALVDLRLP
ncbi:GDYXXLXY domain-containing protein [uncultured Nocardioides sp.]|jgi:uncharacterized membrane-anchored protein|uniref:GDYXXLXY domain-containing protein n=1 Tax=uncultured Nocardioides sp. TaxID=198441 RepID=UPI00262CD412|nr:GDYXXLXY domain-containing protein [uncultured Nocardioides sp.]